MVTTTSRQLCPRCGGTLTVIWSLRDARLAHPRTLHRSMCENGCDVDPEEVARAAQSTNKHTLLQYPDGQLLDPLRRYVQAGLDNDEYVVVIAEPAMLSQIDREFESATSAGLLIPIDAAYFRDCALGTRKTLAPANACRTAQRGPFAVVTELAESGKRTRVYGEVVALLWADGHHGHAIEIEEHWNRLQISLGGFQLMCGYPQSLLQAKPDSSLDQVHTHFEGLPSRRAAVNSYG